MDLEFPTYCGRVPVEGLALVTWWVGEVVKNLCTSMSAGATTVDGNGMFLLGTD
jgi:hypothetical protein